MTYKILLIVNDPEIRASTSEILELASYQVIQASDGKNGIEQAIAERPDIIVTEITMPGLDGFGVLHLLQGKPWFGSVLFIVLCSVLDKKEWRRAMELGADDVIIKPFEGTELLSCIEARIRKQLLRQNGHLPIDIAKPPLQSESELLSYLIQDRNIDRYNKRQLIIKEGERPTKVYYVVCGKARSFKTHPDGKDLVIDLYGPGDYIGFEDLLSGSNYSETVETLDYTELAIIPRKDFEELIQLSTLASKKFIEKLIQRSARLQNRLLWLAYHSLRQKVAAAILQLKQKYNSTSNGTFEINLNRAAFASIAGTATESSIRTLGEFKAEHLIELEADGTIRLVNEKKLSELVL
jgi:CRP/FNR family cyclic AMP-dependent transcriptional regulator